MSKPIYEAGNIPVSAPTPVVSVSPVVLSAPGRGEDLQVRVSAPVTGSQLPIIVFAHGFGSSLDGYAPLAHYWAAHGFVVLQPTFLDSRTLSLNPKAGHSDAIKDFLADSRKLVIWRFRVEDVKRILDQLDFNKEPRHKRTGYLVEQASLLHVMQLLVWLALLLDIRGDHSFITMLAYGTRKGAV